MRTISTGLFAAVLCLSAGCPVFTSAPEQAGGERRAVVRVVAPPEAQVRPAEQAPSQPEARPLPPPPPRETVSVRHVLVQYRGAIGAGTDVTRTKEDARARAEAALARIRGGEALEAVARDTSDDATAEAGGDLGELPRRRAHPVIDDVAFGLDVGEVSGIVESPFGFHVIERYR